MTKLTNMVADNVTFGVELETVIPVNAPVTIGARHNGRLVRNAPAFAGSCWRAERDGSISAPVGFVGCEFVSPILHGAAGVENLVAVIEWIVSIGGKVNTSCGCHIHVGVTSVIGTRDAKTVADYVKKFVSVANINTEALYAQTGKHRDLGAYTKRLTRDIRETLAVAAEQGTPVHYHDRYRIVNVQNVQGTGTVEVRAFAGTLNAGKVLHHLWCVLFLACFARELKAVRWSGRGWQSQAGGTGEKSLRGLWQKMGNHCLIGPMAARKNEMKTVALAMARKYDARGAA
jgi:hypothetical protein